MAKTLTSVTSSIFFSFFLKKILLAVTQCELGFGIFQHE